MDALFNTNFENSESTHFEPKVKLRAQTYQLQESNVQLKLTVVNTVGFGDQMNKEDRQVVYVLHENTVVPLKYRHHYALHSDMSLSNIQLSVTLGHCELHDPKRHTENRNG
ncbi:UNVERIFIED_CONTAM: hypothetical protein FKN15_063013 [Acipenser sinensis]